MSAPHMPNIVTSAQQRTIAAHYLGILKALGYDPSDPHLADTPARVARFLSEWHTNKASPPKLTTFANADPVYDAMVATAGLRFFAVCAHHGVPFFGTAAVAYIPGSRVVGLSKMARVLDHFANRFTLQERITNEVADYMQRHLRPRAVGVVLMSEHLCMSMRGVKKPGHCTITSDMRGSFRRSPSARAELLALLESGR